LRRLSALGQQRSREPRALYREPTTVNRLRFFMPRSSLLAELWAFMRVRKKWWLMPIVVVMLAVGMLIAFAQGSALAPFIYTLF